MEPWRVKHTKIGITVEVDFINSERDIPLNWKQWKCWLLNIWISYKKTSQLKLAEIQLECQQFGLNGLLVCGAYKVIQLVQ